MATYRPHPHWDIKRASAFATIAPSLVANGYRPLPIKSGTKEPATKGWRRYEFRNEDAKTYAGFGTALLTGEVVAVDIDVREESIASSLQALVASGLGKGAPTRIGQAPKIAFLYRVDGGAFRKLQTQPYHFPTDAPGVKAHRVEILAEGQQLVAYGIHPDTHAPYRWNGSGNPLSVRFDELPGITEEEAHAFIKECDALLSQHGTPVGRGSRNPKPARASSFRKEPKLLASDPEKLRDALASIPNDNEPYEEWVTMCYAIKGALGDDGEVDWMEWSALSDKHDDAESAKTWEAAHPTEVGAGTIFHRANESGWGAQDCAEPPAAELAKANASFAAVLRRIEEFGLYKGPTSIGRHAITCPWVHQHPDKIEGCTHVYEPSSRNNWRGGFRCNSGHCAFRHMRDLELFISRMILEVAAEGVS